MDFLSFDPDSETCLGKICGLRSQSQAEACAALGADAIGVNFWRGSKRYLDPSEAGWLTRLSAGLARIGVFVNASDDAIAALFDQGLIDAAQLHGDESPETCARLRERGFKVLKAIGVRDESSLKRLPEFEVDAVLLDAFDPAGYGGTGRTFRWELAREARALIPGTPIILSGGLDPDNIAEAVRQVRPFAVNVASGVERKPGDKDLALVEAFLQALR